MTKLVNLYSNSGLRGTITPSQLSSEIEKLKEITTPSSAGRASTETSDTKQERLDLSETLERLNDLLLAGEKAKKLSQLIAESWLPRGNDYRDKFLGDQKTLKQFLIEKGIFDDQDDADEVEEIKVERNVEGPPYLGAIDIDKTIEGEAIKLKLFIPYPDRHSQLTDEELEKWINNTDPNQIRPSNLYIPQSCS